jgi:hypothetical protein
VAVPASCLLPRDRISGSAGQVDLRAGAGRRARFRQHARLPVGPAHQGDSASPADAFGLGDPPKIRSTRPVEVVPSAGRATGPGSPQPIMSVVEPFFLELSSTPVPGMSFVDAASLVYGSAHRHERRARAGWRPGANGPEFESPQRAASKLQGT